MKINGSMLRDAFIAAAAMITKNRQAVDELNVYPVPDGDTGTNMSMTMNNTLPELTRMDDHVTACYVAERVASALLRGARGNSGVILSLLFRGFAKGIVGVAEIGPADMARGLEKGVRSAYKAVMKPTEGTILTVARMASERAGDMAKNTDDVVVFWEEVVSAAERALALTPEMLPVLKKSGVVDAGGEGLVIIWNGMLDIFRGVSLSTLTALPADSATDVQEPTATTVVGRRVNKTSIVSMVDDEITFTYCTEVLIRRDMQPARDPLLLRAFLETIGDCVVVVDDEEIIKVHVHTEHPGKALEEALRFGALINIKIENMREQHDAKVKESSLPVTRPAPVKPEKLFGFVAVAPGGGVEALFRDLGVDSVVKGGQTMNPSTDDILRAIEATPAETVFVLPNNKNIIMAAEQAVKLADRNVCVLQSRFITQGLSAMLAFDENVDFVQNRTAMAVAMERVQTGQVTFAARGSDYEGHAIRQGEILAMENGKLSFTEKDINRAAYRLVKRLVDSETSYVTVIYGADVSDEKAEELVSLLRQKAGDRFEINAVRGGQPVYYYYLAVE